MIISALASHASLSSRRLPAQTLSCLKFHCPEADCPVHLSWVLFSLWNWCGGKQGATVATIQPAGWGDGQDTTQVVMSPTWVLERQSGPCLLGHSHLWTR